MRMNRDPIAGTGSNGVTYPAVANGVTNAEIHALSHLPNALRISITSKEYVGWQTAFKATFRYAAPTGVGWRWMAMHNNAVADGPWD